MTTPTKAPAKKTAARAKKPVVRKKSGRGNAGSFGVHDRPDGTVGGLPSETADAADVTVWNRQYAKGTDDKVKAFMAELESQVADLATDENWLSYLDMMSKFHRYSANNQRLIMLQRPGATDVAGYNTWKALGRQVRKDERGISILAPKKARVAEMDATGKPVLDAKGKPVKRSVTVGMTTCAVFDVSQTEGPDLPSDRQMLSEEPPAGLIDDLERAIADQGFTLAYEPIREGKLMGYTTTDGSKRIVVKEGMSAGSTARVLAHELGHVKAGHIDRVDDYHQGHDGHRGQMEVEADSISYALLRANGMSPEVGQANAAYVSGWGKRDPETVKAAATTVAVAVTQLFKESTWVNASVASADAVPVPVVAVTS